MRFVLLIAAFVCAAVATAVGFEIITVDPGPADSLRVTAAWLSWSFALFVLAHLVGERP